MKEIKRMPVFLKHSVVTGWSGANFRKMLLIINDKKQQTYEYCIKFFTKLSGLFSVFAWNWKYIGKHCKPQTHFYTHISYGNSVRRSVRLTVLVSRPSTIPRTGEIAT